MGQSAVGEEARRGEERTHLEGVVDLRVHLVRVRAHEVEVDEDVLVLGLGLLLLARRLDGRSRRRLGRRRRRAVLERLPALTLVLDGRRRRAAGV